MGLPEIRIAFQKAVSLAVSRSTRGLVAVLLKDDTTQQFLTPFTRWKDVKESDWNEDSLKHLKLIFKGGPKRVLAVRMLKTDGTADLSKTLTEISPLNIDYLCFPGYQASDLNILKGFLDEIHENGKKMKAVLPMAAADSERIINFATNRITARWEDEDQVKEYSAASYCCRVAGILAALPLTQSCTYYELPEVVDASLPDNADQAVDDGQLVIVFDGEQYKLGRGVTSLTTVSVDKSEELKKIKIVEGMDVIIHDIYSTYENSYVGKVVNNYDNKQMFVGAVNDYLSSMTGSVLDGNATNAVLINSEGNREYLESKGISTSEMSDQQLKEANTGSWMFLTGSVKFLDAAEDLDLQMYM